MLRFKMSCIKTCSEKKDQTDGMSHLVVKSASID